jgi:hypothetical protein
MLLEMILFLCYSILLFSLIYYIVKLVRNGWNIEAYFLSWFSLLYILIPILFILNKYIFLQNFSNPDFRINSIHEFYSYYSFFIVIIFLFIFFLTKKIIKKENNPFIFIQIKVISFNKYKFYILKIIAIFLSILSFSSLFIYVSQYGGFEEAIQYANLIRSGYGQEVQIGSFVFVKRFISFSMLSLLVYIYFHQNNYKNNFILLGLIPLGTALFSKIFLFASKEEILSLGLLVFLFFSIKNKKSYILKMFIFSISAIMLLSYIDQIFLLIQNNTYHIKKEESKVFLKSMEYFTTQQISLEIALQKDNYTFSWFLDLITNLKGTFLPSSFFSESSYDTMKLNTTYFRGEYKSTALPGLLAFAYYSAGILGIIITSIISSILIVKTDSLFKLILSKYNSFAIFYAFLIIMSGRAISTGMPRLFFYDHVIVVMIISFFVAFKYKIKKGYHE